MDDGAGEAAAGDLVNLAYSGTTAVVGTSLAASVLPDTFGVVHAVLAAVLFAVGTGALLWAYALGVSRSRTLVVTMAGLFFLSGPTAPPTVRRRFRLALAVQTVAVVAAASARPYTDVAFGVLAPMYGLGLMSLWGARHGSFTAKDAADA